MAFKEVLDFEFIAISEAREIMENIIERRRKFAELTFETRRAMKHLRLFSKLSAEEAKKLISELESLPQVGRRDIAVKLVDIMPRIPDEVRIIFAKERFTITPDQIKEILGIIDKYR